jgi:hypothetical protein
VNFQFVKGSVRAGTAGVPACRATYANVSRARPRVTCILVACIAMQFACSRSNNLLLGRVESTVAGHRIEVTDCYRTSVPPSRQLPDLPDGKKVYEFMPCRDADVVIHGDELIVNGTSYGNLKQGDVITVDHGKVLINEHAALANSPK